MNLRGGQKHLCVCVEGLITEQTVWPWRWYSPAIGSEILLSLQQSIMGLVHVRSWLVWQQRT